MILRHLYILFLLTVYCLVVDGQSNVSNVPVDSIKVSYLKGAFVDGDTMPHVYIDEVQVVPPWRFKNKRQRYRYNRLVINIKKTLPYARLADRRLKELSAKLDTIYGDRKRKAFLKASEKELFEEFEKPLKKLTFSQGRMLIKLIDRETGDTSYQLIKDLKGGFSAFMWQSVARIFGSNLKSEYDGAGDDAMIEHIILMIDNGLL